MREAEERGDEVNPHTFFCDTSKSWTSTIGLSDLGLASEDNLRDLGTLCKMDCTLARSLMWISVLLHCILTPISVSQTQMSPKSEGRSFLDIYNRSKCQPRWVLLNLLSELPQFSDYLFQPPCVSVQRCAGCCLDEAQSCFPLQWHNVRMEVYRKRTGKPELTIISIVQHTECECRPHDSVTMNPNRLTAASGGKKAKKRKWKGKKEKETYRSVV
ncbi:vascular endothelial growth factor B [Gastrophryne carolinensis]